MKTESAIDLAGIQFSRTAKDILEDKMKCFTPDNMKTADFEAEIGKILH